MKPMKTIRFIKDAAGYKEHSKHSLDEITARVLVHRGYAEFVKDEPVEVEQEVVTPPAATTPKKPATIKPKVAKVPANRAMTAKKATATTRQAPKKNEYETKGSHAKDADE